MASYPLFSKRAFVHLLLALLLNHACGLGTMSMSMRVYDRLAMSVVDEDYYSSLRNGKEQDEEEFNLPSEAIKIYHDKQRMKREWSDELEQWKRLGIEARRDRRRHARSEQLALKAKQLARKYILAQDIGDAGDDLPKSQLERASAFFERLLEHLFQMEQVAIQRGKQRAIQRELDVVSGNATEVEVYLEELATIREYELEKRRGLQKMVFELPGSWNHLDDETLLTLLRIRGNAKRVPKLQKREAIEQRLRESFSKPLF